MKRVIVAFSGDEIRQKVLRLLASEGWDVIAAYTSGAEVIRKANQMGGAAIICGFRLTDMTADVLAADLRGTAALLVLAKASYLELCGGENLYKLALPVTRADFFASLGLLMDFESRHPRRPAPRRKEEEQRVIKRAKELLMEVNRMTEEEAHRYLQKRSMERGAKMADMAQSVIDSYAL